MSDFSTNLGNPPSLQKNLFPCGSNLWREISADVGGGGHMANSI